MTILTPAYSRKPCPWWLLVCLGFLAAGIPQNAAAQWERVDGPYPGGAALGYLPFGGALFANSVAGVFRSTDDGITWISRNQGLPPAPNPISSMRPPAVSTLGSHGPNLFAGCFGLGVYRSTDSGSHWSPVNTGFAVGGFVRCFCSAGGKLFVGGDSGLFVSTNEGASWARAGDELPLVCATFVTGSDLYIGTSKGVYRSIDNGVTWVHRSIGIAPDAWVTCFAANGSLLFAGSSNDTGVYVSRDSGLTWTNSSRLMPSNISAVGLTMVGKRLVLCSLGGLFLSSDSGISWQKDSLFPRQPLFTFAVSGPNWLAGYAYSTDSGKSWKYITSGPGYYDRVQDIVPLGDQLFAAGQGGVYRSRDAGTSWQL